MAITDQVIHTPEKRQTARPRGNRQTLNTWFIRRIAKKAALCCVECTSTTEFILTDGIGHTLISSQVYGPGPNGWFLVSLVFNVTQWGFDYRVTLVAEVHEGVGGGITLLPPQQALFLTGVFPSIRNLTTHQTVVVSWGTFLDGGGQDGVLTICGDFYDVGALVLVCPALEGVEFTLTIIDSPDSSTIWESTTTELPYSLWVTPFGSYTIEVSAPWYVTQQFTFDFEVNWQTESVCLDPI